MSMISRLAARAERAVSQLSLEASVHVVAARRGLTPDAVRQAGGAGEVVRDATSGRIARKPGDDMRAKQEALYLTVTHFGRPVRSVARAAGLSAPAVLKAVRAVEDRRDEGGMDRILDELELELMPGGSP